jgi:hypothetical protein
MEGDAPLSKELLLKRRKKLIDAGAVTIDITRQLDHRQNVTNYPAPLHGGFDDHPNNMFKPYYSGVSHTHIRIEMMIEVSF